MTSDLVARRDCVSATWTPHQRLHPGNVAWSHSRGDGSPAPDATLAWGEPLTGFADVWQDGSPIGPVEVSLHVSPQAAPEERRRIVQELIDAFPALTVEVSRQDVSLVEVLAIAGFREGEGPWFAQLWRELRDTSDLEQHSSPPGYRIRSVDIAHTDDVFARVEIHRRAWAPARIMGLLGLEVAGTNPDRATRSTSTAPSSKPRRIAPSSIWSPLALTATSRPTRLGGWTSAPLAVVRTRGPGPSTLRSRTRASIVCPDALRSRPVGRQGSRRGTSR